MNRQQVAMVLCIVGWAILCILPDNVDATDKFFQTGGRFGKRRENRYTEKFGEPFRKIYRLWYSACEWEWDRLMNIIRKQEILERDLVLDFYLCGLRDKFGNRFTDLMKPPTMENVPPRIERGFYISRYGKRNSNLFSDTDYFTLCLSSYGLSCDYIGLSNLLRCKRIRLMDCSTENLVDDKVLLKSDDNMQNFKND